MKDKTSAQVYIKVDDRTSKEFQNIAFELGHSLQAHEYHLAAQLMGFIQMFNFFTSPSSPYVQTQQSYVECSTISKVDYDQICFYFPPSSIEKSKTIDTPTREILNSLLAYNDLLPSYLTSFLRTQIQRFQMTLQLPNNKITVIMLYPAQPVNATFEPSKQSWYLLTQNNPQKIVLSGPDIDYIYPKSSMQDYPQNLLFQSYLMTHYKNITSDKSTSSEVQLVYNVYFNLQFTSNSIRQLFSELNYLTSAEVVVTDFEQNLIYAPSYWNANQYHSISKIYDYPQYCGFTLNQSHSITNNLSITQVPRLSYIVNDSNSYIYEMVRVPITGIYSSTSLTDFIDQTLSINNTRIISNTRLFIYIYGMKSEMQRIYQLINTIIDHEDTVIILLTLCSCINTIAIVFIFTYMVAVKISRPLRKLITTASQMSSTATQKNVTTKILQELDQIEANNQIADLIEAFKNLVRTIDSRNKTQKSTAKQQIIQYPLNQYDPEFISRTKGESDINWQSVIGEIEDN